MASPKAELRVHVVAIGPEEDRAVLPLISLKAEKVYLVVEKDPHPILKRFKERIVSRITEELGLKEGEDIITDEYYEQWNDFTGIVSKFSEIVKKEQEAGNKVWINISSGSKFASIAGTLVALMNNAEAYYVQAEVYNRLEDFRPDTTGVKAVISIPKYKIEKVDERWVYALSILNDYPGGMKQTTLAEKLINTDRQIDPPKALLRDYTEEDPKEKLSASALNNILRREYLNPMEKSELIEVRGQRRGAMVYITENGKTALGMFLGSNSYWKTLISDDVYAKAEMKIRSVRFYSYKQFNDQKIDFGDDINIVLGEGGAGKSIIFRAIREQIDNKKGQGFEILTEGKFPAVSEIKILLFMDGKSRVDSDYRKLEEFARKNNISIRALEDSVLGIYKELTDHTLFSLASGKNLSNGKDILFMYSYVFAIRKILKIKLPLVIDSPISYLEKEDSKRLIDYLTKTKEQIILFMLPGEWARLEMPVPEGKTRTYLLKQNEKTGSTKIISDPKI